MTGRPPLSSQLPALAATLLGTVASVILYWGALAVEAEIFPEAPDSAWQAFLVSPFLDLLLGLAATAALAGFLARDGTGTERRAAERAEAAVPDPPTEMRLADVLAVSQGVVLSLGCDGRIAGVSRQGELLLGMATDRMLGRVWVDDFVSKSARQRVRESLARMVEEANRHPAPPLWSDEYEVTVGDGSFRTLSWRFTVRRGAGGEVAGLLGSGIDITDHRQTERTLRNSERLFRNLFDYAGDPILIVDLDTGGIIDANELAVRHLGYNRMELLGRNIESLAAPDTLDRMREAGEQLKRQGWVLFEQIHLRKDGTPVPVEINARLVEYGGRIVSQSIVRDLTERKAAERNLIEAKAEAERANAAKSKFLAAASHDLRQPVHAISLFTGALVKRPLDAESMGIVRQLASSVESFEALLNSLLHISRLDAGVLVPRRSDFPIDSLLSELENEFGAQAADKGIGFRLVHSSLAVNSDPGLLGRILRNLITNAVRHTSSGRVLVGCRRRGGKLALQVWDTGEGIPEAEREAIFREFYQIGNPERDRERGLGLGLAIVDRLARLLDHPITLESREGVGSVFSVTVPVVERPVTETPVPEPALPASDDRLEGACILVIEDDREVREASRVLLRGWGCEVLLAANAQEALDRVPEWTRRPDLVIADFRLPQGWTGVGAIQKLGEAAGWTPKGIVVTGDTDPERIREANQAGFHIAYKPLRPARLRALVTRLLSE